uniref:Uncharacterized protein n=1 Tax=Triticum urartu TaxID=4572 RepID=A0A8R7Q1Y7_TRIUA
MTYFWSVYAENGAREAGEARTQGSQHWRASSVHPKRRSRRREFFDRVGICSRHVDRQEQELRRAGWHPGRPERPGLVPPVKAQEDGGGCRLIGPSCPGFLLPYCTWTCAMMMMIISFRCRRTAFPLPC